MKEDSGITYGNEQLIEVLQRIAVSLNERNVLLKKQNELIVESIDTGKRLLAVNILNAKVNARTAVSVNALSVLDHKEFIELVNQV